MRLARLRFVLRDELFRLPFCCAKPALGVHTGKVTKNLKLDDLSTIEIWEIIWIHLKPLTRALKMLIYGINSAYLLLKQGVFTLQIKNLGNFMNQPKAALII